VRAPGWPVVLVDGAVRVRPLSRRDARAWCQARARNAAWLAPWESTVPDVSRTSTGHADRATYRYMLRSSLKQAKAGQLLPLAVDYQGRFAGQITVSAITRAALHSATIGYWVDQAVAGRGVMPTAVALVVDHCFRAAGLHRVELNVRPENHRSRRLAEKLGFRNEGLRLRYLHIDGAWRDHECYAMTVEDAPDGVLRGYKQRQANQ
jgi:[ribosomal protein S5]-alanine N-acetyltransferase